MDEPVSNERLRELLIGLTAADINARVEAINALGFSRRLEAIKPLKGLLKEGGTVLRSYAKQALGRLEADLRARNVDVSAALADAPPPERPADPPPGDGSAPAPPARPSIDFDKLKRLLADNDPKTRIGAIQAAAQLAGAAALPLLRERLAVEYHLFVIASLVIHLGKVGSEEELPLLYPFLLHDDERIRANAVEALGAIGRGVEVARLIPLLQDPSERVKTAAARTLAQVDPGAVADATDEAARSKDTAMRDAADSLSGMRERPAPVPKRPAVTVQAPRRAAWPAALAALLLLAAGGIGFYHWKSSRPAAAPDLPAPVAAPAGDEGAARYRERLAEAETLVAAGRLELAEVQVGLLLRDAARTGETGLTAEDRFAPRLLHGEILLARGNLAAARGALDRLVPPPPFAPRHLLARARIEAAAGDDARALPLLEELCALPESPETRSGAALRDEIRARFRAADDALRGRVAARHRTMLAALAEAGPDGAEPFFLKRAWPQARREWEAALAGTNRRAVEAGSFEVRIRRDGTGLTVTLETIELLHLLRDGNTPALLPFHRLYEYTPDDEPAVRAMLPAPREPALAGPLAELARATRAALSRPEEGEELLAALLARAPGNGHAALLLAESHLARGAAEKVLELLGTGECLLAFDPPLRFGDARLRARAVALSANALRSRGDRDGYLALLARASELDPDNALILLERYVATRSAGDEAGARAIGQALLRACPDFPHFERYAWPESFLALPEAERLVASGNLKDAAERLTTMIQRDPDYWRPHYIFGIAFASLERHDQAIGSLEKAHAANPRHAGVLRRLALSLFANEEFPDALRRADEALALDPGPESRRVKEKVTRRDGR